jgi:hypothetical protein
MWSKSIADFIDFLKRVEELEISDSSQFQHSGARARRLNLGRLEREFLNATKRSERIFSPTPISLCLSL